MIISMPDHKSDYNNQQPSSATSNGLKSGDINKYAYDHGYMAYNPDNRYGQDLTGLDKVEAQARGSINNLLTPYRDAAEENPYNVNQREYKEEVNQDLDTMRRAGSAESVQEQLNPMMDQMLSDTQQAMAGSAGAQLQSSAQNARTADQIARMSGEMWNTAFDQDMKRGDMAGQAALHSDKKRQALNESTHEFTQLGADLEAAIMDMWGGQFAAQAGRAPGGSSCVPLGTAIKMADGSLKKIEDIKSGEFVKSWKLNGTRGVAQVWHVYKSKQPVLCYEIICEDGSTFIVSRDHAMQTKLGITCIEKCDVAEYIPIRKLKPGMSIAVDSGWCKVRCIRKVKELPIAELFLEKDYYYSLADGLISVTPNADIILQTVPFDHPSYEKYEWPKEHRNNKPMPVVFEFIKFLLWPLRRAYASTISK